MGYTHYIKQKKQPLKSDWDKVIDAKNKIVAFTDVPIEDLTDGDTLDINGIGDDSHENLYHNPFELDGETFNFVKTASKPYDVVIVAILCAINDICEGCFEIKSDGDASDWIEGNRLASDACSRVFTIPLSV